MICEQSRQLFVKKVGRKMGRKEKVLSFSHPFNDASKINLRDNLAVILQYVLSPIVISIILVTWTFNNALKSSFHSRLAYSKQLQSLSLYDMWTIETFKTKHSREIKMKGIKMIISHWTGDSLFIYLDLMIIAYKQGVEFILLLIWWSDPWDGHSIYCFWIKIWLAMPDLPQAQNRAEW